MPNDDLLNSLVQSAIDRKDNAFLDQMMGGNQESLPAKPSYLASIPLSSDADPGLTVRAPSAPSLSMPLPKQAAPTGNGQGQGDAAAPADDGSDVRQAIAQKYGFGDGLDDQALQAAQGKAAEGRKSAMLASALDSIGKGLAHDGSKVDDSYYNELANQANTPVQNILERRKASIENQDVQTKQEDLDPASVKATIMRKQLAPLAAKVGLDQSALNNLGVSDLKNFSQGPLEFAAKLKQQEETSANNLAMRQMLAGQQRGQKDEKLSQQLGDALDPDKGRAGNFGAQQNIVYAAKKIGGLAKQFPDGNLPPMQMAELAGASANMISNGNGAAESTIARFVPNSIGRDEASLKQWLTNEPHGTNQQAFVKQMLDTAQREGQIAESNVKKIKYGRVAQFNDLQKRDPQTWSNVLQSHDIDPNDYKEYQKNGYKLPEPAPSTSGPDQNSLEAEMRKRGLLK